MDLDKLTRIFLALVLLSIPLAIALEIKGEKKRLTLRQLNFKQLVDMKKCQGCDFFKLDLKKSDLSETDLTGANLSMANLTGAYLGGGKLK